MFELEETGQMVSPQERQTAEQKVEHAELFEEVFGTFLKELEAKVNHGNKEFETITEDSKQLILLFGEDPTSLKPMDLFDLFYSFAKEFSTIYINYVTKLEAAAEKQRRFLKKQEMSSGPRMSVRPDMLVPIIDDDLR